MKGSMIIFEAESEEQVRESLAKDPYVADKVWEKWEIYPYRM